MIDELIACPICGDRSTFKGDPAASFCDEHYRQYLATFQIAPRDLAAYRATRLEALSPQPPAETGDDDAVAKDPLDLAVDALKRIEKAPAWGAPDRWETTPAEVRWLARDTLAAIEALSRKSASDQAANA